MKNESTVKNINDENTRVFNLKWHQDGGSKGKKSDGDESAYAKNYDNNLLFKSPQE